MTSASHKTASWPFSSKIGEWKLWAHRSRMRFFESMRESLACLGYHSGPSFLIIGAQKCGTSALHSYLCRHPKIQPARRKEIGFFDRQARDAARGEPWYHSQFPWPFQSHGKVTFEATPEYIYSIDAALRIYRYDPNMKMIVLLRDPVERAYSSWNMFRKVHQSSAMDISKKFARFRPDVCNRLLELVLRPVYPPFADAVREEIRSIRSQTTESEPSFVRRGIYAEQMLRFHTYFRQEQILIIESSGFRREKVKTLGEITAFLCLPPHDWESENLPDVCSGSYESPIDNHIRDELYEFYQPYNEQLFMILAREFPW